ncbi:MAG: hypothetical protein Q9P90_18095, partial [candidate division KSB1 bacterium]|nr:hypothetical protein [candidate division KSB1 bacterium]
MAIWIHRASRTFLLTLALTALTSGFVFPQTGSLVSSEASPYFQASNQNKLFPAFNRWWLIARSTLDRDWYLWRYDAANGWLRTVLIDARSSALPDAYLDPNNDKLYVLNSHKSTPKLVRLSYGTDWQIDAGFPVSVPNFAGDKNRPISMVRDPSGQIWLFQIKAGELRAVTTADEGTTWSAPLVLVSGLNTGLTDCVIFYDNGQAYVGVAFSDKTGFHAGFLKHKVGDPDTAWSDESDALTPFGAEATNGEIAMAVAADQSVYLFLSTYASDPTEVGNLLFKRTADSGQWQKFRVNERSASWSEPAITLDETQARVYLFGITAAGVVEYKSADVGGESTFATTTPQVALQNGSDVFEGLSSPRDGIDTGMGLLIAAGNSTATQLYFVDVLGGGSTPPPPAP